MRRVALLCLVLVGCGHKGFYKPDADYKEFYSDLQGCQAEVSPRWQFCGGAMCGQMAAAQTNARNHCMMARGWIIRREEPKFVP